MDGACDLGFQISDFRCAAGWKSRGDRFVANPPGSSGVPPKAAGRLFRVIPPCWMEPSSESMPGPPDHEATVFLAACFLPPHSQEFNLHLITNLNRSLTEI
jgi:hypothetical protein